ncbi:MAG: ORF6N domain-containing protein [Treponema sp.]|nr:ORF6N domain-containing protein [Treponema sp.]
MEKELISVQNMIYEIRGQKVMLDHDLAVLYEVEVKTLNRAVKRNIERFPDDFMFQSTDEEWNNLKNQIGASSLRYHFGTAKMVEKIRYNPYAFTEQGIAMLSGLLNSKIAINVNIQIMRAFIKLRNYIFSNESLNEQIIELRKLLLLYIDKNDKKVNDIIIALNNLLEKPKETKTIGFKSGS